MGGMGAGKTTLIKGFCSMLEVDDVVTSPTFSVINEYCCRNGDLVYHFDFYRIKNETEAWNLGAVDLFDSGHYCFIEWPSNARALLPPETIFLEIIPDDNNDVRNIILRNTID
jgi:tRNA threonylcarbamoyladenosine biosynthesis protein TsaE